MKDVYKMTLFFPDRIDIKFAQDVSHAQAIADAEKPLFMRVQGMKSKRRKKLREEKRRG